MNYKVAKTQGLNTDQTAAQVLFEFCGQETVFLGVLRLSSDDAFVVGRTLLSDLANQFCEDEGGAGEKLTALFNKAKEELKDKEFSLLLAAAANKVLYLIGSGEISATLKRSDSISTLLDQGGEQLISGFLTDGDKVFLSTLSLKNFLGNNLEMSLRLPLNEWEDEMSVRLSEEGIENEGLAGLVLEVFQEKEEPAEDQSEPTPSHQEMDEGLTPIGLEETKEPTRLNFKGVLAGLGAVLSKLASSLPKSGRIRLIIAIVLIVIIGLGAFVKFQSAKSKQSTQEFNNLITQANSDKTQAEQLKTLNIAEATSKLNEAISLVDQALKLKPNDQGAKDLKAALQSETTDVSQNYSGVSLKEFLDLSSAKSGFKGDSFSLSGGRLLVLDPTNEILLSVNLSDKTTKTLASKADLGNATLISLEDTQADSFSADKGVVKVDLGGGKATQAIKPDDSWGSIKGLGTFSGNIYLLDTGKNQIWKYLPTSSGYSDARNYFTQDNKVDTSLAVDLQIDSSIYLLTSKGEILKFTKGAKDSFAISGLDKNLSNPKKLFTSPDVDNVYVLDSGNSRVVVLDKSGNYKAQYAQAQFGGASDLVADEKNKLLYVLEGSKIYTTELK